MVSAIIGTLSLFLGHVVSANAILRVWRTWWLGDFCGALIVLPLALAFGPPTARHWPRGPGSRGDAAARHADRALPNRLEVGRPVSYLAFPALIWAALRFGPRGASVAITISSGFAIWGTTHYPDRLR